MPEYSAVILTFFILLLAGVVWLVSLAANRLARTGPLASRAGLRLVLACWPAPVLLGWLAVVWWEVMSDPTAANLFPLAFAILVVLWLAYALLLHVAAKIAGAMASR